MWREIGRRLVYFACAAGLALWADSPSGNWRDAGYIALAAIAVGLLREIQLKVAAIHAMMLDDIGRKR